MSVLEVASRASLRPEPVKARLRFEGMMPVGFDGIVLTYPQRPFRAQQLVMLCEAPGLLIELDGTHVPFVDGRHHALVAESTIVGRFVAFRVFNQGAAPRRFLFNVMGASVLEADDPPNAVVDLSAPAIAFRRGLG
jgi:hypothetical protein